MWVLELRYPGSWLDGMRPEESHQAQSFLWHLEVDLADIAVTLHLFEQARASHAVRSAVPASGGMPLEYERRLPFIYAHSFLFALDGLAKKLSTLKTLPGVPPPVTAICDQFSRELPGVVAVRNSAHHQEDRLRGLARNKPLLLKPIDAGGIHAPSGGVIVMSILHGNQLGYTTEDGHLTQVEVSASTAVAAQKLVQAVLDAFSWRGPERVVPG